MRTFLPFLCSLLMIAVSCKAKDKSGPDSSGPKDPAAAATTPPTGSDGIPSGDVQKPDLSLTPPANLKVAIIGDQGITADSRAVLNMIKKEGVDLLLIAGDFDYIYSPDSWDKLLQETIGDMPVLAAIGNHDGVTWSGYTKKLQARLSNMPKAKCEGEIGVQQKCIYDGLLLAISGIGIRGKNHERFLEDALKSTDAAFKICLWHKTQRSLQAGDKSDETGWGVFETCREQGAIVMTAHEHSYARTHLLSNFEKLAVVNTESHMVLEPGHSFSTVSGLGGKEARPEVTEDSLWRKFKDKLAGKETPSKKNGPWFAKIYTATQNAKAGAVLCTFHVDNDPRKAHCVFKNIADEIVDDYTMISKVGPGVAGEARSKLPEPEAQGDSDDDEIEPMQVLMPEGSD